VGTPTDRNHQNLRTATCWRLGADCIIRNTGPPANQRPQVEPELYPEPITNVPVPAGEVGKEKIFSTVRDACLGSAK
jgi:hypothetical protein